MQPKAPLYLTFDDGPRETTPAILDELEARGATATFFQIGRFVAEEPDVSARAAAAGHTIGNHTRDHVNLGAEPADVIREQLETTSVAVAQATGRRPTLFRAPWLDVGDGAQQALIREIAASLGMHSVVGCHVDARDYVPEVTVGDVVERVVGGARPRAVVMLHDDLAKTAQAIGPILDALSDRFSFQALPEDYRFESNRER